MKLPQEFEQEMEKFKRLKHLLSHGSVARYPIAFSTKTIRVVNRTCLSKANTALPDASSSGVANALWIIIAQRFTVDGRMTIA